MEMPDTTVMGLEPTKYVKIVYILLLVSSGIGVLTSVLALAGIFTALNPLITLVGIIGLIMAVIGWAAFKEKFATLELDHLKYIILLFLVFLVVGIVVGAVLLMSAMLLYAVSVLLGIVQVGLLFTGFNSWQHGRTITKDNLQGEVKAMLNRQ